MFVSYEGYVYDFLLWCFSGCEVYAKILVHVRFDFFVKPRWEVYGITFVTVLLSSLVTLLHPTDLKLNQLY